MSHEHNNNETWVTYIRGPTFGGFYVPGIYLPVRWELAWVTQVFVFVWHWLDAD